MLGQANNRDDAPEYYLTAWTSTPADYNCVANGPNGATGAAKAACGAMVGVSGTLVVTRRDGTDVTIPASILQPGKYWRGQIAALKSTSTAQDVMLFW